MIIWNLARLWVSYAPVRGISKVFAQIKPKALLRSNLSVRLLDYSAWQSKFESSKRVVIVANAVGWNLSRNENAVRTPHPSHTNSIARSSSTAPEHIPQHPL